MSDYAEDLVRQWELNDPRDRWRHTGERPPSAKVRNSDISNYASAAAEPEPAFSEEAARDVQRMSVCDVCGTDACCGYGVTVDGIRMGDVGSWRCADHHPERLPSYSREQWAAARAAGSLYPGSKAGEWQHIGNISAQNEDAA